MNNNQVKHIDEAKQAAIGQIYNFLSGKSESWRIILVEDLFVKLRVVLRAEEEAWESACNELNTRLSECCGPYWSKSIIRWDDVFWKGWNEAMPSEHDTRFRILERYVTNLYWFNKTEPPWALNRGPHIVVFHSFDAEADKAEMIAKSAIWLMKTGVRVVVIDTNFISPGLSFLTSDSSYLQYGVADYLLERRVLEDAKNDLPDLEDYYFVQLHNGPGKIFVFPAGNINNRYLENISRLSADEHFLRSMLQHIRTKLDPNWILINSEPGFSDFSGLLLNGFCHLCALVASSEQVRPEYQYVLNKLKSKSVPVEVFFPSEDNCVVFRIQSIMEHIIT